MAGTRDPLREWRDLIGRRLLNLDFRPLSDEPFRATMQSILDEPGLRVTRSTMTPGLTFRDAELVKDGTDAFALVISLGSTIAVAHQSREVSIRPGEATLLRVSEPGTLGCPKSFGYASVLISPLELASCGPDLDLLIAEPWPRSSGALRLLKTYLGSLQKSRAALSPKVRSAARRHVLELAKLAAAERLSTSIEADPETAQAARFAMALDDIAARFQDPSLTVASIAHAQEISPRYLQRILKDAGVRFTEHLNELRLMKAFERLADLRFASWRIAAVALDAGFSDVSHFNRLFRVFGETPRAVRGKRTNGGR